MRNRAGANGFLLKHRYLSMDRDPLFTHAFRTMLAASGVKPVRLPARSPNHNAFAEQFVGSVRRECLARVIPLGESTGVSSQSFTHFNSFSRARTLRNRSCLRVASGRALVRARCA